MKGYLRTFSARLRALPKKKAHDDFGNDPLPLGGNSCRARGHPHQQTTVVYSPDGSAGGATLGRLLRSLIAISLVIIVVVVVTSVSCRLCSERRQRQSVTRV